MSVNISSNISNTRLCLRKSAGITAQQIQAAESDDRYRELHKRLNGSHTTVATFSQELDDLKYTKIGAQGLKEEVIDPWDKLAPGSAKITPENFQLVKDFSEEVNEECSEFWKTRAEYAQKATHATLHGNSVVYYDKDGNFVTQTFRLVDSRSDDEGGTNLKMFFINKGSKIMSEEDLWEHLASPVNEDIVHDFIEVAMHEEAHMKSLKGNTDVDIKNHAVVAVATVDSDSGQIERQNIRGFADVQTSLPEDVKQVASEAEQYIEEWKKHAQETEAALRPYKYTSEGGTYNGKPLSRAQALSFLGTILQDSKALQEKLINTRETLNRLWVSAKGFRGASMAPIMMALSNQYQGGAYDGLSEDDATVHKSMTDLINIMEATAPELYRAIEQNNRLIIELGIIHQMTWEGTGQDLQAPTSLQKQQIAA